jgi:hypothetical protein
MFTQPLVHFDPIEVGWDYFYCDSYYGFYYDCLVSDLDQVQFGRLYFEEDFQCVLKP